jgi:O-antigen/teichoic acid export membrane protein
VIPTGFRSSVPSLPSFSGLTAKAVSGAGWIFASTTLGRVVAMLGQIGIGWLLKPEDFGVWALALAMSSAVMALRNGGTTQILIQRGHGYPGEAQFFLRYSLAFNLFAAAILLGLSIPYLLKGSAVGIAMLGIGMSVPLATPAMLSRAKLTIDGRFRSLALISLGSSIVWQASVFALAYAGFGAASFACAPVLQAIFETLAGRVTAGSIPRESSSRPRSDYVALLRQSSWIMMSAAILSLGTTGDYFAVGLLTNLRTVGIYYFGFQTVVALSMPIYNGIESVMPTLLVKLNDDPSRQIAALVRAMRTILIAALPLAVSFALAAPLVIHLLWHGKWDIAARATQILAACVPAWLIIHCARALLEARGFWQLRFGLLAVNGVGGITSAAIGTLFGGVEGIAASVAVFYVSFSLSLLLALGRLGLTTRDAATIAIKPLALNCAALLSSLALTRLILAGHDGALHATRLAVFLALAGAGNLLLFRDEWTDLLKGFAARARTTRIAPAEKVEVA